MGNFRFCKRKFKCWYSRPIIGKHLSTSLNEDARGRWYINVVCDQVTVLQNLEQVREIGIDLGCKDQIVCSDGVKYNRQNLTKQYEDKLAKAPKKPNKLRTYTPR